MSGTSSPAFEKISRKRLLDSRVASAAVLIGVLAIAVHVGPLGPLAPTTLATQVAAGVTGLGFWGVLGCVGCIAGFVMGAGTTVAGLAVFLAAHPEIAIFCVSTCVNAAS
jgi:hypothetical protein